MHNTTRIPAHNLTHPCPCDSGLDYSTCCLPCHDGSVVAATAEALMRSRYSAYSLGLADYVLATWHPNTRPATLDISTPPQPRWLGLKVKHHQCHDNGHAQVEFVARYKMGGRAFRMHEVSQFIHEEGRWWYIDGEQLG